MGVRVLAVEGQRSTRLARDRRPRRRRGARRLPGYAHDREESELSHPNRERLHHQPRTVGRAGHQARSRAERHEPLPSQDGRVAVRAGDEEAPTRKARAGPTGGVVTSPPGGVVTSPPDPSCTSVHPRTVEQPAAEPPDRKSNGASRRVSDPTLLAAAQGRRHQRGVLRRVAWELLREQADHPDRLIADTQTRYLENLCARLEALHIVASPEQITRAGTAMWQADIRQHYPELYRYLRRRKEAEKNA